MKASIIVPVYNAERYLDECIRSALDQTYSDTEVIAVDDGSTDSSPEILKGYADRVRVLTKPNGGTASALNAGISRMTGAWFKWLSADDLVRPRAIELLAAASARCKNPIHIVYGNLDIIDGAGRRIGEGYMGRHNRLTDFQRNVRLLDVFYGSAAAAMIPAPVFARAGVFDERIGFNEDYEFWLRCCLLHGVTLRGIKDNVAAWRSHGEQISVRRGAELAAKDNVIRRMVLDRLPADLRGRYVEAAARVKLHEQWRMRRRLEDSCLAPFCVAERRQGAARDEPPRPRTARPAQVRHASRPLHVIGICVRPCHPYCTAPHSDRPVQGPAAALVWQRRAPCQCPCARPGGPPPTPYARRGRGRNPTRLRQFTSRIAPVPGDPPFSGHGALLIDHVPPTRKAGRCTPGCQGHKLRSGGSASASWRRGRPTRAPRTAWLGARRVT